MGTAIMGVGPGVTVPMAPIAYDGIVYIGNASGDHVGVTARVFAPDVSDRLVAEEAHGEAKRLG